MGGKALSTRALCLIDGQRTPKKLLVYDIEACHFARCDLVADTEKPCPEGGATRVPPRCACAHTVDQTTNERGVKTARLEFNGCLNNTWFLTHLLIDAKRSGCDHRIRGFEKR